MSDNEEFLARWSRRKREAKHAGGAEPQLAEPMEAQPPVPSDGSVAEPANAEIDLSSLPPVDSIDAATDITAYLRKGIPQELLRAALRRAWSADPGIRDFMGPNENYWDAAGPDGIPGFGDLDPGFDVKRLVAELFGEAKPEQAKPETSTLAGASGPIPEISETSPEDTLRTAANVAPQQQKPPPTPAKKIVRRHGGAKPE